LPSLNLHKINPTLIHRNFGIAKTDTNKRVDGDIINGGVAVHTSKSQNNLTCPFGFTNCKDDSLGVIASSVSVNNDILAIGNGKLPSGYFWPQLHWILSNIYYLNNLIYSCKHHMFSSQIFIISSRRCYISFSFKGFRFFFFGSVFNAGRGGVMFYFALTFIYSSVETQISLVFTTGLATGSGLNEKTSR
jgi:hypothetical protein